MRPLILCICLCAIMSVNTWGEEAVQTDWSGGHGIPGPVTQWIDCFAQSQVIDWAAEPGALTLLPALPLGHAVTTSFVEPAGVAAADLDGDDDLDIISVAFAGNEVAWFENDGYGGGWNKHLIAADFHGACSLCAVDIDGDDDFDVAATAEEADEAAWWENDGSGSGWTMHVVDDAINGPFSICGADLDEDTDIDLCTAAFYAGDIVWWENLDGAGTSWTRHSIDEAFPGAWWAVVADIDGDTHLDVVGGAYYANDICWWENDGSGGGWLRHDVDLDFPRPVNLRTGDIDGDLFPDILGVSFNGELAWWKNDGAGGGWSKRQVAAGLAAPFSSRLEDLDGDGDRDVISNERNGDRVKWWANVDGLGTLWLEHVVDETSSGPNDVLAADVYGDARPEVIGSFSWDHSILWYEPVGDFAASGTLESSIFDAGRSEIQWGSISWSCATPPNTSATVEVRASGDPGDMGDWTTVPSSGEDLSTYIDDGDDYFQYRLSLASADGVATPCFNEIAITWDHVSSAEPRGPDAGWYLAAAARPTPAPFGSATIHFSAPHECRLDLTLYDVHGRTIKTLAAGCHSAGDHVATVEGLPGGFYFYQLRAEDFEQEGILIVN